MVLPKWLRPKTPEPTMHELRQQVRAAKEEIQSHASEIIETCKVRRSGKTVEIRPQVTNGSH